MDLIQLYDYGEDQNIYAQFGPLTNAVAMTAEQNYGYEICLNARAMIRSERFEKVCLAHEIGHCETGALYSPDVHPYPKRMCERQAWIRAYKRLVPEPLLRKAVSDGVHEVWDLAEYFSVPDWFMYCAICYYKHIQIDESSVFEREYSGY